MHLWGGFSKLKIVQGWSLVTPAPAPAPPSIWTQSCRYRLLVGSCSERRPVAGGALSTQQPHGDSLILLWTHGHYAPHITLSQHYNKCTEVNRDPGAVYTETHSVIIVICYTDHSRNRVLSLFSEYTVWVVWSCFWTTAFGTVQEQVEPGP